MSSSGGEKNTDANKCTAAACDSDADITGDGEELDGALPLMLLAGKVVEVDIDVEPVLSE